MDKIRIKREGQAIRGAVMLDGSKSISNRVQIIRALCSEFFSIENLSTSNDSVAMQQALAQPNGEINVGAAGTTFRFLTAYLSTQPGEQILTGSERMKNRPIGSLVDALRLLGANIEYLEKVGYPPLKIGAASFEEKTQLTIPANISSQFISALLMIAPSLPNGLTLHLEGKIVSVPYIKMTLSIMEYFGVSHTWTDNTIRLEHQAYKARPFFVESDWSAASYYYGLLSIATPGSQITLQSLEYPSLQGDSVIAEIGKHFSIESSFNATNHSVVLTKTEAAIGENFEWDFINCPDIAQTVAVMCAATNVRGIFTGLETLRIKETDRIAALHNELAKVQAIFTALPPHFSKKTGKEYFLVEGQAVVEQVPEFATYEDHRMAMAFAPLALLGEIAFEEPNVVAKSYPKFWEDFEGLGFVVD